MVSLKDTGHKREMEIFVSLCELRDKITGKRILKLDDISEVAHAPSARTLQRWVKDYKEEGEVPMKKIKTGRPSLLTATEKLVLGGWYQTEEEKPKYFPGPSLSPGLEDVWGYWV